MMPDNLCSCDSFISLINHVYEEKKKDLQGRYSTTYIKYVNVKIVIDRLHTEDAWYK